MRRQIYPLTLIVLSMWLGWTLLVDFIVIPTTFRELNDFFGAGNLGIQLFIKLNNLELILATLLFALYVWIIVQQKKINIFLITMSVALFALTLFYFAYLTPKIALLTSLWQQAETQGSTAIGSIPDIQQEHQYYHRLYVSLDTAKVILLLSLLAYSMKKPESLA
jgi:hypothetical protein